MIKLSALAIDRRQETLVVMLVSVLIALQGAVYYLHQTPIYSIQLTQLIIQGIGLVFLCISLIAYTSAAVWSGVRAWRLGKQRPLAFRIFLVALSTFSLIILVGSIVSFMLSGTSFWPSAPLFWLFFSQNIFGVPGLLAVFGVVYKCWPNFRTNFNELGVPAMKPIHIIIYLASLVALFCGYFALGITLCSLSYYLGIRFAFNRWIYMKATGYPFKHYAAKAFVRIKSGKKPFKPKRNRRKRPNSKP